jgi:outer membrane immunogenic protein
MKRFLLGAGVMLVAGPALAADLPPAPPPPQAPATYVPAVAPIYNWSGFYGGFNGGYGFGSSKWTSGGLTTGTFDTTGGFVGETLGANFQSGQFVFGIESDVDWADVNGSTSNAPCVTTCQTTNDWFGTVRLRAGYAFDRVLLFASGGAAFGDIKTTLTGFGSTDNTEAGWTVGGGIEVALAARWTAKAEYLFVDLTNGSCACAAGGAPVSVTSTANLVRLGLNYKFIGF